MGLALDVSPRPRGVEQQVVVVVVPWERPCPALGWSLSGFQMVGDYGCSYIWTGENPKYQKLNPRQFSYPMRQQRSSLKNVF